MQTAAATATRIRNATIGRRRVIKTKTPVGAVAASIIRTTRPDDPFVAPRLGALKAVVGEHVHANPKRLPSPGKADQCKDRPGRTSPRDGFGVEDEFAPAEP